MELSKFQELKDLIVTIKKNPTRTYSEEYIQDKENEIEEVWEYYKEFTGEHQLEINLKLREISAQIRTFMKPKVKAEKD